MTKRHNTRPLPDLSHGRNVLFLSPVDQMSYLEGTIVSQANTPRSYIIEAQGHRYRHNRQHIKPVNTNPPSLLARPYMHKTHQSHNNPIISGPQESMQQTHTQHPKYTIILLFQDHHNHTKQPGLSGT